MKENDTIVHFTTIHPRHDTRIFVKQVCGLAADWSDKVSLIVADGFGDEMKNGVEIHDLGSIPTGRLLRVLHGSHRVLRFALTHKPAVCHFHDPELIPAFLFLKLRGQCVVYDAHEDVPMQILTKHWIPRSLRPTASALTRFALRHSARRFDGVVVCTPTIEESFAKCNTALVRNFPRISEFDRVKRDREGSHRFAYIGTMIPERGAKEIVSALSGVRKKFDVKLDMAGLIAPAELEQQLRDMPEWAKCQFHGYLDREGVFDILSKAIAGLVTLHPTRSYMDSYPVKLFEYMAAGLPVIASDFPVWRDIVESAQCGILVDPLAIGEISGAMNWILENPEDAAAMGARGRTAVLEHYNWKSEYRSLAGLYKKLLS